MTDETRGAPALDARQLNVLVRMLHDPDPVAAKVARRALEALATEALAALLADPGLEPATLEHFAELSAGRPELLAALRSNPSLPPSQQCFHASEGLPSPPPDRGERACAEGPAEEGGGEAPRTAEAKEPDTGAGEEALAEEDLTLPQRVQSMTVGQKIKLAMQGNKEARTLLIKDTNREVYMAVLNNPGLKENEVEMLAKSTSTSSDILRVIAKNRDWTSNTAIVRSLVMNSKTPVEVTMRFLPRLSLKDLDFVEKSRNLPAALRSTAKRLSSQKRKGG